MSRYTSMLIDALLIGFVLYTLIHGTLARYLAFAGSASGTGGASTAGTAAPLTLSGAANIAEQVTPIGLAQNIAHALVP